MLEQHFSNTIFYSNATTFASFNQTKDYFVVLEEVSKYNVQLNIVEKLWAVCPPDPYIAKSTNNNTNIQPRLGTFGCRTTLSRPVS
jgi:hypothetical protein